MRVKVIYNPVSGTMNFVKLKSLLLLNFPKWQFDFSPTNNFGHASRIAKKININEFQYIIIAGGDGTINEVINGLNLNIAPVVSIFPYGTANVLSYDLGINNNIDKAIEALKNGKRKKIYIGLCGKKRFLLMTGIGFDAFVVSNVDARLKKFIGKMAFVYETLKAFINYQHSTITININNRIYTAYSAIIANAKHYAGSSILSNKASLQKNKFQVIIFMNRGFSKLLLYSFLILIGKVSWSKNIKILETNNFTLKAQKGTLFHCDGELVNQSSHFKFEKTLLKIKSLL